MNRAIMLRDFHVIGAVQESTDTKPSPDYHTYSGCNVFLYYFMFQLCYWLIIISL